MTRLPRAGLPALIAACCLATPVLAGGYDTGERNYELLFDDSRAVLEVGGRHIAPKRSLTNVTGALGPSPDVREAASFQTMRISLGARLTQNLRCLATWREPYGGKADHGTAWPYAMAVVVQDFTSRDIGLTCALGVEAGPGRASLIGGVSDQKIRYVLTQEIPFAGAGRTDVSDRARGWRIGAAYEMPQYGMRISLIHHDSISFAPAGSVSVPGVYSGPAAGRITMPSATELRVQTGVAPRTLVFGILNRTRWSVTDSMPLCPPAVPVCTHASAVSALELQWRNTTRVTLGLARQISDHFTLALSGTHDQGATRGFTTQTTLRAAALDGILDVSDAVQLRVGGVYGRMKGGRMDTSTLTGGVPNPLFYQADFSGARVLSVSSALLYRF